MGLVAADASTHTSTCAGTKSQSGTWRLPVGVGGTAKAKPTAATATVIAVVRVIVLKVEGRSCYFTPDIDR